MRWPVARSSLVSVSKLSDRMRDREGHAAVLGTVRSNSCTTRSQSELAAQSAVLAHCRLRWGEESADLPSRACRQTTQRPHQAASQGSGALCLGQVDHGPHSRPGHEGHRHQSTTLRSWAGTSMHLGASLPRISLTCTASVRRASGKSIPTAWLGTLGHLCCTAVVGHLCNTPRSTVGLHARVRATAPRYTVSNCASVAAVTPEFETAHAARTPAPHRRALHAPCVPRFALLLSPALPGLLPPSSPPAGVRIPSADTPFCLLRFASLTPPTPYPTRTTIFTTWHPSASSLKSHLTPQFDEA
jgi:hypothetical protein